MRSMIRRDPITGIYETVYLDDNDNIINPHAKEEPKPEVKVTPKPKGKT